MKNIIKRTIVDVNIIPVIRKSDFDIKMRRGWIISTIGLRICLNDDTRIYIYAQLKGSILEHVVYTVRTENVDTKVIPTDMQLNRCIAKDAMYTADLIAHNT